MIFKVKDRTNEILDGIWCDDYYIVSARELAPTEHEIKQLAKEAGVKLPKEYIAHASGFFGGLYLEVKEEVWSRAKAGDVGPFWSFLYGIHTYAYSEEAPEWMSVRGAVAEFKDMGHNVLPILKVMGDADVYCLSSEGNIVRWSHEEDIFDAFNGNFFDLLAHEIKKLDERRKKKKVEHI